MKIRNVIAMAFLGLIATVAVVFVFLLLSKSNDLSDKLAKSEIEASQAAASLATSTLTQATIEAKLTSVIDDKKRLATQVADLTSKLRNEEIKNMNLEESVLCEDAPDSINYSGNSTVSNSLKEWLENTEGKITDTSWEIIWNNSKTSIHKLTGKYLYYYVVYFDEEEMSYKNSIFDVSRTCWVNK